ncbi:exodeoxyribonuclease VII large subunit [Lapidilactobacillus luobeiensis]|uniref:exodeoxyribonuclease VII large subunit n=1 Tax=Lapidilactobacillus luobeiensis TaxID=2950371 RepID=UPI0021C3C90F|nr:exodeoxyribonuclease VII large subunit [Lapidilactobacillus luobeiensis]
MVESNYLSVTQLTTYLKRKFDYDPYLQRVYLTGEISNFRPRSGHQYFSLKDDHAKINVVMFAGAFKKVKFQPETGMKVNVVGQVTLYAQSGQYQITIDRMEPDGIGALYLAYEQLKEKLATEGLFSRPKRALPRFPKRIAVITSRSGAVIHDIMTTAARRDPLAQIVLFPAVVQGNQAADSLVQRLRQVYQYADFDVIIIGRGGGSIEDLWPFNEEIVARTMVASPIPIISSVGHETDTTIADLVADQRAATPTAAAELATPQLSEVLASVLDGRTRLLRSFQRQLQLWRQQLQRQQQSFLFQHPERLYQGYLQQLDLLQQRFRQTGQAYLQTRRQLLQKVTQRLGQVDPSAQVDNQRLRVENLQQRSTRAMQGLLQQKRQQAGQQMQALDQLSPLRTVARGYSYASDEHTQKALTSVIDFQVGQTFQLQLKDGRIKANVLQKENDKNE